MLSLLFALIFLISLPLILNTSLNTNKNPIEINKPIVTFRQNYVIDGHHTWLQAITLNPNGKILAFNYDGDISPIQMLKAVQGTIAAVKAEDNNNNGKLPSNKVNGHNFFEENKFVNILKIHLMIL